MLSQFKKLKIYRKSNYSKSSFARTFGNNLGIYHNILVLLRLKDDKDIPKNDYLESKVVKDKHRKIVQNNDGIIFTYCIGTCNFFYLDNHHCYCYEEDNLLVIDKDFYNYLNHKIINNKIKYISNYLIEDFIDLYNKHVFKLPELYDMDIYVNSYFINNSIKGYVDLLTNIVQYIKYKRPDNYTLKYANCIKYQFINLIFNKFHLPFESIEKYIRFSKFSAKNILDSIIEYLHIVISKLYFIIDNHLNIYDIQQVLTYWNIHDIQSNYEMYRENIIYFNNDINPDIYKYKYIFTYNFDNIIKKMLLSKNILSAENYYILKLIIKNVKPTKMTYALFGRSIGFIDDDVRYLIEPIDYNKTEYDMNPHIEKYLRLYLHSLLH